MKKPGGAFGGDLGLVSLFDLGQLLRLNGATGCLGIVSGDRKGFLYFVEGRIVNAVDDTYKEGENAAYRLFAWREGSFEFRPEPPDGSATIEVGTEAILMEAARRLDESGEPPEGLEEAPRETERLRVRREALEALRDVFHRVTGEAREHVPSGGPGAPLGELLALSSPGDRLVYRPGHPARRRGREGWTEAEAGPLDVAAYADLRSRLLDACAPGPVEVPGDVPTRRLMLADGREIALEFVNEGPDEAIWLRPVGLPAPRPAHLDGDHAALEEILDTPHGWVFVGGPDPESARRLLHALAAAIAERFSDTVLIASNDTTYRHVEAQGVVMRVAPERLEPALRAAQPEVVAIDPVGADAVTLEALEPAPRVLAGVVAPDAASMATRWLARAARGDLALARGWLGTLPLALVLAQPAPEDPMSIPFAAWRLAPAERTLALEGKAAELAASLQRARPTRLRVAG